MATTSTPGSGIPTAVATARPDLRVSPPKGERLQRFDRCERIVHWANAVLFGILLFTAAVLYIGQLSAIVGRRELIRQIHVVCGLLLPAPLLLGLLGPWRRALRVDIRSLNRWDGDDRRWLRSRGKDQTVRLGKFNPGQKLNASFVAGVIVVALATGSVMEWFHLFPVDWRTGATFVHDWMAISIFMVIVGHIGMAFADPDALRAIFKGWVPASWAKTKRPKWFDDEDRARTLSPSTGEGDE